MGVRSGPKLPNTDNLLLCLDAMNAKSFAGEPATNLKGNEDFSTMTGYTGLDLVQVAESQSPSGYACRMTINSSLSNGAARSRFGSAGSIPTSGSGFVSVYVKGNTITESNGLKPSVFAGSSWVTLLPLDGGPNHITQEYRKFGAAVTFGTASGGPNPGFSMVQVVLGAAAPPGARTFWIKPMVTTKDHSVPFTSGTRAAANSWRDLSGNGNHGTHSATDFGDSGDPDLRRVGQILLPDAEDITTAPASINFDGSNDSVTTSFGSGRNVYTSPTTFVAWVKSDSATASKMWLDHGSNGSNQRLYCALITADNPYAYGTQSTAWFSGQGTVNNADTSKWYHQALVMDSGTVRAYYDANAASTRAYTSYTLPGNTQVSSSRYEWDGQIACFAIYNTALSHADIKQIYNAQKNRFGL